VAIGDRAYFLLARHRERRVVGPVLWSLALMLRVVRLPAARGRRAQALGRFVRWQAHRRRGGWVDIELAVGGSLTVPPWSSLGGTIAAVGVADPEARFLARVLRADDVFVDVGANIGLYSVVAAAALAHVEAIEPSPRAAAVAAENLSRNPGRHEVRTTAVSIESGEMWFRADLDVTAHLVEESTEGAVRVPVTTIDALIAAGMPAPTCIKVDAEGADLDVLRGARTTIETYHPILIAETWGNAEIAATLVNAGYELACCAEDGALLPLAPGESVANVVGIHRSKSTEVSDRLRERPLPGGRHRVTWRSAPVT
jgi:FkbM family methyltransferase